MTVKVSARTEHKNAIVKLVKQKKMILLADLASVMNNKNIKTAVERLVSDGKIKRQKIKVRGPVGNLTNQWLIHENFVKQNDILDFEREMINKTFQSPLVENHCYKSVDMPVEQILKESNLTESANEILDYFHKSDSKILENDQKSLTIVTNEVIPIYNNNNKRMVNARELHEFLQVKSKFADWVKNRIKKYSFIENEDFETVSNILESGGKTIEYYFTINTSKELAMVENNDRGKYIRKYFIETEEAYAKQNSIQQINGIQSLDEIYSFMKMSAMGFTDLNNRVKSLEGTIESMKKAITA